MNKKLSYVLILIPLLLVVYVDIKDTVVALSGFNFKEFCVSVSEIASATPEYILRGLSISKKDKLDSAVGEYWHDWKASGKDTVNCIVDFDKVIMPFEWDTLVYVKYCHYSKDRNSAALMDYMNRYFPDDQEHSATELHFLRNDRVVHKVNLYMISDDAKGVFFCTKKDIIKRSRSDAKFHLEKDYKFFVIRDTTEEFVPMIGF